MPLERAAVITCAGCDEQLQHCHGTAVIIDETTHVCSDDPDCTLEVAEHWFVSLDEM
jgi:hypothetical protein